MRRVIVWMAFAAVAGAEIGHADSQSFTLSTGFNETALTSEFNRGTALQAQVNRGRQLYRGSFDSRGLTSLGVGRIVGRSDPYCQTERYPVLTLFSRPGEPVGLALDLHQDWYWHRSPARAPSKYLTVFRTRGGVVCQEGQTSKVRVTHKFVTTERRHPSRSQGVEWVWEFRPDYPNEFSRVGDLGQRTRMNRRTMRIENWAFFSRELGIGVVQVSVGATHKTVERSPAEAAASGSQLSRLTGRTGPTQLRVPVLMARVGFTLRRW